MKRKPVTLAACAALLALALAACAAPQAPGATPSPAAATPTAGGPAPTATPTGAFTPETPPAALRLPAPLYALELGQIARYERDAATRTIITSERVQMEGVRPIAEFAVSPLGTLAYIVGDLAADRLVVADARGRGPLTLYERSGHELSNPLFTPDGERLLFRLLNNLEPPDIPAGIYSVPLAGGDPELIRADDPVDDVVNPSRAVSGYLPVAFSPDGSRLLVRVDSTFYEDCTLGVMPAAGGEVVRVALPDGVGVYCGEEAWTADGAGVLFMAGPPATEPSGGPGLWRADAATGAAAALLPADSYARAPAGLPGDVTRFFLARVERDAAGAATGATFVPAEARPGASAAAELGPPIVEFLERALWAPDGAGAVVVVSTPERLSTLRWLPIGREPVTIPSTDQGVFGLAWGVE